MLLSQLRYLPTDRARATSSFCLDEGLSQQVQRSEDAGELIYRQYCRDFDF
jgi:hypothetical protein